MPARILRLISRESITVFVGYGTAGVTLLLSLKLLTHFLTPAQYGLFTLALSAQIMVVQLAFGPLGASVLRLSSDALARAELPACIRATHIWLRRAIFVCVVVGLCGVLIILQCSTDQIWLYLTALIAAITYGACFVGESLLSGTRHRTRSAISSVIGQLLRSGIAILGAALTARADVAMFGYMAGSLLATGSTYWLTCYLKHGQPAGNPISSLSLEHEKRSIADYGKPFLLWAVPTALYMISDRWLLNYFRGPTEVAVLVAAQQLAQLPVNFLFQFMQLFWAPILFAERARARSGVRGTTRTLDRIGLLFGVGCLVGTALLYWIAGSLVRLFANPNYLPAATVMPLIFLGSSLFQLGQWYTLDQLGEKRSDLLVMPKLATAILGIIAIALGSRYYGLVGVAIASVVTSAFFLGTVLWTRNTPPIR